MSLFVAREFWTHRGDAEDEYDTGGLLVLNDGEGDRLVTGSLRKGLLRVYQPSGQNTSDDADLLLEERLNAPILQLCAGRFSTTSRAACLAVLHPHKLLVCSIVRGDNAHKLQRLYEHVFRETGPHFTAANMCFGPFGRAYRDSIAVQSMDGQVIVYEQEKFAFRRNLNAAIGEHDDEHAPTHSSQSSSLAFLIPGPMTYCPRTDSLLTISSEMKLTCFSYSALAAATGAEGGPVPSSASGPAGGSQVAPPRLPGLSGLSGGSGASTGRKLRSEWTVNLGEHAHMMAFGRVLPSSSLSGSVPGAGLASKMVTSPIMADKAKASPAAHAHDELGEGESKEGHGEHRGALPSSSTTTAYSCDLVVAGERGVFVVRDNGPSLAAAAAIAAAAAGGKRSISGSGGIGAASKLSLGKTDSSTSVGGPSGAGSGRKKGSSASTHLLSAIQTVATASSSTSSPFSAPGDMEGPGGIASAVVGANGIRSYRKTDYTVAAMALFSRNGSSAPASLQSLMPEFYQPANEFGGADEDASGSSSSSASSSRGGPLAGGGAANLPHGLIMVSHTGIMQIYKEEKLIWAAKLPPAFTASSSAASSSTSLVKGGGPPPTPVAVTVGRFAGTAGLVAIMNTRGDLTLCYCGTDPPVGPIAGGEAVRELNYAAMDKEHKQLLAKIREMQAAAAAAERGSGTETASGPGGTKGSAGGVAAVPGAATEGPLQLFLKAANDLTPPPVTYAADGSVIGGTGAAASSAGASAASGLALGQDALLAGDDGKAPSTSTGAAARDLEMEALVAQELEALTFAEWEGDADNTPPAGGALASRPLPSSSSSASASSTSPLCMVTVKLTLNPAYYPSINAARAPQAAAASSPTEPPSKPAEGAGAGDADSSSSSATAGASAEADGASSASAPRTTVGVQSPRDKAVPTPSAAAGSSIVAGAPGSSSLLGHSASSSAHGAGPAVSASALAAAGKGAKDIFVSVTSPSWALLPRGKRNAAVPALLASAEEGSIMHRLVLPFRCSPCGMPTDDLSVTISVVYCLEGSGETRTATCTVDLPLSLVCPAVPPLKGAAYKLTLETNRHTPPSMMELFSDTLTQPASIMGPDTLARIAPTGTFVLSFGYRNGADATILVSKSGGKYRVQAGSLEALTLVTTQLIKRLGIYFTTGAGAASAPETAPFSLGFTEALPLTDYFSLIEAHFNLRKKLVAAYTALGDRCHEYRLVTKRLLVRWRDTSPAPLNGLDRLLEMTQDAIQAAARGVEEVQHALAAAANRLACVTALLHALIRARYGFDNRSHDLFTRALPSYASGALDSLETGWEEVADAGLVFLLKAIAAKPAAAGPANAAAVAEVAQAAVAGANISASSSSSMSIASGTGAGALGGTATGPTEFTRLKQHLTAFVDVMDKAGPKASTLLSECLPLAPAAVPKHAK